MDSIRFKNYRCFSDTGNLEIKPLNFLVGANSSGKSSVLKFFPLLKQSAGQRLNGVFSWLGEDVDFKDFKNVIKDGEKELWIEFGIKKLNIIKLYRRINVNGLSDVSVRLRIVSLDEHFDRIDYYAVTLSDGTCLEFFIDKNNKTKIHIDEEDQAISSKEIIEAINTNSIFPRFDIRNSKVGGIENTIQNEFLNILNSVLSKTSIEPIRHSHILAMFPVERIEMIKRIENFLKCSLPHELIDRLYKLSLLYSVNTLMDSLNLNIINISNNITYIKPLRSIMERYYRFQNYAINSIDSDGKNLPMFLYNQPNDVQILFRKWMKSMFDIEVFAEPHDGHVEMMISCKNGTKRNLVDMGFGFTQMLPILALIWNGVFLRNEMKNSYIRGIGDERIIVIEQPELHLHPRFQSKFAKMLISLISDCKSKQMDVRFIIETHSETILNEIGSSIAGSEFNREDVNVFMFVSDDKQESHICCSSYNKDGFLNDWPVDFF